MKVQMRIESLSNTDHKVTLGESFVESFDESSISDRFPIIRLLMRMMVVNICIVDDAVCLVARPG